MIGLNENESTQKPTLNQKQNTKANINKTIVRVPIQMTLSVPVEIDIPPDKIIKKPSEVICDAVVVDAIDNQEALLAVMTKLPEHEAAISALASLQSAAFKTMILHPDIRAFFTTFAGIIEEKEFNCGNNT